MNKKCLMGDSKVICATAMFRYNGDVYLIESTQDQEEQGAVCIHLISHLHGYPGESYQSSVNS